MYTLKLLLHVQICQLGTFRTRVNRRDTSCSSTGLSRSLRKTSGMEAGSGTCSRHVMQHIAGRWRLPRYHITARIGCVTSFQVPDTHDCTNTPECSKSN